MNSSLSKLPVVLLIGILLILAIFSCKKDPYEIGFDLLPPSDTLNVKSTDTITVEAFSVIQDSVRTDKVFTLIMGSMMDPVFGRTTAGFYSQVRLSSEGVDFGSNPVLDSLVLMLPYNGYYGDTLSRLNVKVYEISDEFSYDSLRYSNQRLATYPTVVADQDFIPRISDSVLVYSEKLPAHLRINLSKKSNYLGQKILNAPIDALATNQDFIKFFKGVYVTASPVSNNGALLKFNINSGLSKMVVYFHDGNDPQRDSLSFDLLLNPNCARFIHIDHHGYLDAREDLKQQILNHDSARGANNLFLQGMGGVKIKLKFPYLKDFGKGKNIAINEAILQLKNLDPDTTLAPPPSLIMIRQDSAGRVGYLVDDNEGAAYFGGTYDQKKRSYFFRLTQHMQKVLLNAYTTKFDLYLMVNSPITSAASPNRVMLHGTKPLMPGDNSSHFQLKMTYTVLNQ
ncbi:MAG: DUF4270 domain-containing protein [Bacteroidales bacterium]|nr:DUF4270 domain-containing protein [Bacteroidales bacterium]